MNWICQSVINRSKTDINAIPVRKRPGGTAAILAYRKVSAIAHPQQTHLVEQIVKHTQNTKA